MKCGMWDLAFAMISQAIEPAYVRLEQSFLYLLQLDCTNRLYLDWVLH